MVFATSSAREINQKFLILPNYKYVDFHIFYIIMESENNINVIKKFIPQNA